MFTIKATQVVLSTLLIHYSKPFDGKAGSPPLYPYFEISVDFIKKVFFYFERHEGKPQTTEGA